MECRTIEIIFLGGIECIKLNVFRGEQLTCEYIIWECLTYVQPKICSGGGKFSHSQYLPAFGLLDMGETKTWYPLWYKFDDAGESITCMFRVRFRPHIKLYKGDNIVWEYFVLQARDDFMFGDVGTVAFTSQCGESEVKRKRLIMLCKAALIIPEKFPLNDSEHIQPFDKSFRLHNYHKKFSRELYGRINQSKYYLGYILDYFHLYGLIRDDLLAQGQEDRRLGYYKKLFVFRFLKTFPQYCFEVFDGQNTDSTGSIGKVLFFIRVYSEGRNSLPNGLYFGKHTHKCRLNEVADVSQIPPTCADPDLQQWKVRIDLSRHHTQESTLLLTLPNKEQADALISMLQGYLSLCLNTDCFSPDFAPPSMITRLHLESFRPLSQENAKVYLKRSNTTEEGYEKPPEEQYKYLLYQDEEKYNYFNIASVYNNDCDHWVEWKMDRKLVETFVLKDSFRVVGKFTEISALKIQLDNMFGLQLPLDKYGDRMDNIFAITESKRVTPQSPTPALCYNENDFTPLRKGGIKVNSEDPNRSHLTRMRVKGPGGKDFMLLQIDEEHSDKRKALIAAIKTHSEIQSFDLNSDQVMKCYGPTFFSSIDFSWVFEYAPFGTLTAFLKVPISNKLRTEVKVNLAFQVVSVLNLLDDKFHGNIRGENFFVFIGNENELKIKLGDPGLAHFFDERPYKYEKENEERTPWLAPERRRDLKNVKFKVLEAEIYSVGTVIAEIFHQSSDFRELLNCHEPEKLSEHFCGADLGKKLKPKRLEERENEADSILEDAWKLAVSCWNENPSLRPKRSQLERAFFALVERAEKLQCARNGDAFATYEPPPEEELPDPMPNSLDDLKVKIPDKYKLDPQCVRFIDDEEKEPPHGHFGVVHKGIITLPHGEEIVAIKMCKEVNDESTQDFYKEIAVMAKLDHENIVKFRYMSIMERNCVGLILEFMFDGDLKTYVDKNEESFKTDLRSMTKELINALFGILRGMAYLADEGIVHRDLAARNILLAVKQTDSGRQITAKIGDFGLAKVFRKQLYYFDKKIGVMPFFVYPPEYLMACLDQQGILFEKTGDIWSFGMIVWEVFNPKKCPMVAIRDCQSSRRDWMTVLMGILDFYKTGKRLSKHIYMSEKMYCIVKEACWAFKPEHRLKLTQLEGKFQMLLKSFEEENTCI